MPPSPPNSPIELDHVRFIESQVRELFNFQMNCIERARAAGDRIINWLTAIMVGGVGLAANTFVTSPPLAMALLITTLYASVTTSWLIVSMRGRAVDPPGNTAQNLESNIGEGYSFAEILWGELRGMDARCHKNQTIANQLSDLVDWGRYCLAAVPLVFAVAWLGCWLGLAGHSKP